MFAKITTARQRFFENRQQYRKVTRADIAIFFRQLAALMSAGIPILNCFDLLQSNQPTIALQLLLTAIKRELLEGKHLSASLHHFPSYFDTFTCRLIELSEHTGQLAPVLLQVASHHEAHVKFKKRLIQLLFYPSLTLSVALLLFLMMMLFMVPRFAALFSALPTLPFLTKLIFYSSSFLLTHGFILLLCLIGIVLYLFYFANQRLHTSLKKLFFHLPLIRRYRQELALLQFTRHLAITFDAGIPITDSVQLAAHTTDNPRFIQLGNHITAQLNAGRELHKALDEAAFFPTLLIQMVKLGEESGTLVDLLNKSADFFEMDLTTFTERLEKLLEPLIMVGLGVLIGGLIVGMYLPIFSLGSTL